MRNSIETRDNGKGDLENHLTALESEMTALLQLPPSIAVSEMKMALPCDESLWAAPSAEAWSSMHSQHYIGGSDLSIADFIQALCSSSGLSGTFKLTPFGSLIVFKALQLMVFTLTQLRACNMWTAAESAATELRTSLQRLSRGSHEFVVSLGPIESEWSPSIVSYHLAYIATHVSFEDILIIAGRGTKHDIALVRRKVGRYSLP